MTPMMTKQIRWRLVSLALVLTLLAVAAASTPAQAAATIIYVNHAAAPGGNGTSWAQAFQFLQDGLAAAAPGDQIWVAQGTYYPDEGTGITPDDRTATFRLKSYVAVFGGFAGTETVLTQRNWEAHRSVLSGDIDQDTTSDVCGPVLKRVPCNTSKNSYHVVYAFGADHDAVLDGFTITDGRDTRDHGYASGILSVSANPVLRNLLITNNRTNNLVGGGMYANMGTPSLTHVRFVGNGNAQTGGGATFAGTNGAVLDDVQFLSNDANVSGGGLYLVKSGASGITGNISLNNVVIAGNTAGMQGGGLFVGTTNVQASNIIISGNLTGDAFFKEFAFQGGGIYADGAALTITNGTIAGNQVLGKTSDIGAFGGAISTTCWRFTGDPDRCTIRINNSVLYANSAQYGTEIHNGSKNFYVQNSLVEGSGGSSGWQAHAVDKGGNIDADPQFFVPVDPASAPTIAGDFRQRLASPVVNTGSNALILRQPFSGTTDFGGNARVFDTTVDMGPYEASIKCPAAGTTRLYVNALANGGNLGTSWAGALTKVQDALALVDNCPGNTIGQIWVAQGTYYPDEGYYQAKRDRAAAFNLKSGLAIYGGFLGTETALNQRNPWAIITTLSGDIGHDDHTDAHQLVETPAAIVPPNSYHVVVASGTDTSALLDGFAITAGQADGATAARQSEGGGLFAASGSPTLNNLALVGNLGVEGGGMTLVAGSNALLTNSWFGGNGATSYGAGLHNESSSPALGNVLFSGNRAVAGGGAIYNLASSPTLINVTIASNAAGGSLGTVTTAVAPFGGGMFNFTGSKPVLRNTIIWNNADSSGIGTPSASMRNLDAASTPAADNSDIQGLAGIPGLIFDNTSIDQNPLFVAPLSPATAPNFAGDRRLQSGSPAIDTGDNSFNSLPTDLGQQPRIQDGSGDGSAIIDMGAFEAPKLLAPRVQLAIAANPSTANLGAIITFTYVVTNSGNVTSSIVAGDDTTGPVVFNQDNVPPGAVLAASRQYTVTALDLPLLVNTFYAIAIAPNGSMAQGSTAAVVNLQVSDQMAVTKTASAASVSVGDLITYTYTAQNTGLTGLTGIVAVDDKLGPVALSASLAAGEVTSATLAYVVEESDLPVINNTVTVTATVGVSTVVETRGAAVQVLSNPRISVDKSASAPTAMVGDVITYTYEVRNTGTVTLHSIELVDDKLGPIGLLTTTLAPGAATTATAVHDVQASELPGPINNTAIVTGTGPTNLVRTAQDGATVAIAYRPGLEVQAFGTPASGVPGTVITYTYVVKNSGDVSLTAIGLTDSRLGAVSLSSTSLAPGAVATGSNTYVVAAGDLPGPLTNVATAVGTSPTNGSVQGTAAATTGVVDPNPAPAYTYCYLPSVRKQ